MIESSDFIKFICVVLFLLYCYSLIGGYTPMSCTNVNTNKYIMTDTFENNYPISKDNYVKLNNTHESSIPNYSEKTIYQMGPYLNI